jgi:type I restriction enzyme S subunit
MSFDFPTNWRQLPLEDSLEALIDYRGKTPQKTDKGIPLVTAKVVKSGQILPMSEFIADEDYDSWMVRGFPQVGDIVITTEAPLGEVAQIKDANVALAQRIVTLRGKNGVLNNDYLLFLMQSHFIQDQLEARATGSTVKGIKQSELRKIILPLPPIEEQKKIGAILKSLDNKIQLNNQINQTLESIAQAIFKSWFMDFEPVKAKIFAKQASKDPELAAMCAISGKSEAELERMAQEDFRELQATAALFPDEFTDSELQGVPKGWKRTDISNVTTSIFSGGTPATKEPSFWNGEIPWLSSGETRNKIIVSTEKFITKLGARDSSTKLSIYGDILIASAGQGHTRGQTSFNAIECYINQSIVVLRANDKISPYWLYYCLEPRYDEMRSLSDSHSSRGSLTTKLLASMPVILPTHELIDNFDKVVKFMVVQKIKNLREIKVLADIRDSLLPKLLSGEIDVSALQGVMHD